MQVTRCDRCGLENRTTQPAMLRGAHLDLCEQCTDAVVGDRAEWQYPPPAQGQSTQRGTFARPPVRGVLADELDPGHAARRAGRAGVGADVPVPSGP